MSTSSRFFFMLCCMGLIFDTYFSFDIQAGDFHNCIKSNNNQVKCWGNNEYYALGNGDKKNRGGGPKEMGNYLEIVQIRKDFKSIQLRSGGDYTCILGFLENKNNIIQCWGANAFGQLGIAGGYKIFNNPSVDLGDNFNPIQIATGNRHMCALSDSLTVKCWGNNMLGQLGYGDKNNRGDNANEMGNNLPYVDFGDNFQPKKIYVGRYHNCVISTLNKIKCWGSNTRGQLGYGDTNNRGDEPNEMGNNLAIIQLGDNFIPYDMTLGLFHTCIISTFHQIKCFGGNEYGELGYGDTNNRGDQPNEMGNNLPFIDLGINFVPHQIIAGLYHTCALTLDKKFIKCWGLNDYGQLGNENTINIGDNSGEMGNSLKSVNLGNDFDYIKKISVGNYFTCALFNLNRIKCWGRNLDAELGLGDTVNRGVKLGDMGNNLPYVNYGTFESDTDI